MKDERHRSGMLQVANSENQLVYILGEFKTMSKAATFQFSVDSALLRELGEKLVSSVHVALAELVKNSYDADAKSVQVSIVPNPAFGPTVTIEDDGSGMSPDHVRDFWMRIGTTNKEDNPVSERFGRPRTGKKGVGRFACRRLGTKLELETTALVVKGNRPAHSVTTKITFDWKNFEAGTTVESIVCLGETRIHSDVRPSGTKLVISEGVTDEWKQKGFDYLRRQLAVMAGNRGAKRKGYEEDPGFGIRLHAPGKADVPQDLREQIINGSWGTLEGYVKPDGRGCFTLQSAGVGGKRTFLTNPRFQSIQGIKIRVGILPTSDKFGKVADSLRDKSLLANYVLNKLVDDWGGVQVRMNGFRMFPYGDPGDDWLEIDADRARRHGKPDKEELFSFASSLKKVEAPRVLLTMLGMRNYFGYVDVPADIPGIEPRLDRQGFSQTEAFELMRTFARMAIEWAAICRDEYIRQKESAEAHLAVEKLAPFLNLDPKKHESDVAPKATNYLRREISRLVESLPEEEQAETKQTLLRTVKALETISADNQHQLRHLRLVASASTLTLLFAHEVRSSIASMGAGASKLRVIAKKIPEFKEDLLSLSKQLGGTQSQLSRLVEMTGIVGAFRTDQRAIDVNLHSSLERAISCFRLIIENYSIGIDISEVKSSLQIGPIIEGEIYSILINILSNAIKSLIASGRSEKAIRVWSEKVGKKVILRIADNGIGLDAKHFAEVFTPFISDPNGVLYDSLEENANPEDAAAFGTGSGLGLSIARDIARARGGDIRFINPDDDWAACVEVELP